MAPFKFRRGDDADDQPDTSALVLRSLGNNLRRWRGKVVGLHARDAIRFMQSRKGRGRLKKPAGPTRQG